MNTNIVSPMEAGLAEFLRGKMRRLRASYTLAFEAGWIAHASAAQPQGEPMYIVRSHGSCCWEEMSGESLEMCQAQPDDYEVRELYARIDVTGTEAEA